MEDSRRLEKEQVPTSRKRRHFRQRGPVTARLRHAQWHLAGRGENQQAFMDWPGQSRARPSSVCHLKLRMCQRRQIAVSSCFVAVSSTYTALSLLSYSGASLFHLMLKLYAGGAKLYSHPLELPPRPQLASATAKKKVCGLRAAAVGSAARRCESSGRADMIPAVAALGAPLVVADGVPSGRPARMSGRRRTLPSCCPQPARVMALWP